MVRRFMNKIATTVLALIMVINTIAITAVASNDATAEGDIITSFTSGWTDAADDAWATTDDGDNVFIGVKNGIEALVLRGGASAVEHSCGGWYERAIGNAQPIITEFDFTVNDGGSFHVRGYQDNAGGYNGFTAKGGSKMTFVSNGNYDLSATNPVIVTPDVVHTVRMEVVKSNCTGGDYTQGTKYYLDGVLVYEETAGLGYNKFRLCAGKDSVVKIYEIREWGAISTWGTNKGVTTNFNGQTIDSLMASGRFTELGTYDPDNVSVSIEKANTNGAYLTMERVAGTQATASNASVIYTTPSTELAETYDLNIDFMYKGMGPVEMRFTDASGNAWFTQMKIDDGRLYVASAANEWGEPVSGWITPYTEHKLTLSVAAEGESTKYTVYLDGVAVTGAKSTITSGFGANLPASLKFYSLGQTVGSSSTNQDLMNGILIKSISKDTDISADTGTEEPPVDDGGVTSDNWELNSATNVTTGVEAGKSALVIRTGSTAPSNVYAADFAVGYGSNIESVYEVDFAIKEGTTFGVMALANKIGTISEDRHFFAEITDGKLAIDDAALYDELTNTGVTVEPGVIHTLKMICYSADHGSRTEYYFNGLKVGQTTVAANPKWLRFRVGGANAEAKIYRVAKSNTAHPDDSVYRRFLETFDDVTTIAQLEERTVTDVAGGDGWFITELNNGHTVTIEKEDTSTNYLKMRRTGVGSDNGSLIYTMPSGTTVPADLNITFMYDGAGQNEFRFLDSSGNNWMCRMFTQDGQLYWGTSNTDYVGEVLKGWMAPFTEHTLTLRVEDGKIKIFLDNEYLGTKEPFSSGFGSGLPAVLKFYSLAKSVTATKAERHLYTGLAIKSVSVDYNTNSPAFVLGTISVEEAKLSTVASGRQVTSLQTEAVNYTVTLKSEGGENNAYILIGVYDGDTLVDVTADTVFLKKDVKTEYSTVLPGYENAEDLTLKLLIWDQEYEPVVANGVLDVMLADDDFSIYKVYFEREMPETWNDEYEFSPACGTVDINLTVSEATDITVYSAVRAQLFTIPASAYSSAVSNGSVVTVFVDTDKDAYDVYVDGNLVVRSTLFDVNSDNIGMVKVGSATSVKDVDVVFSTKTLCDTVINASKPSYSYSFADGALPTSNWTYSGATYNSGGYMTLSGNGSSATWETDKVIAGTVEVSWDFNVKSTSYLSDTAKFVLDDGFDDSAELLSITYKNKKLYFRGSEIASGVNANTWHNIKVIYDTPLCRVDIYVDGSLKKESANGANTWYFDELNQLILTSKTSSGMDIRNVNIKPYVYPAPTGYSDDNTAPTLASLIVPAEPTGDVYEAENMERENYAPVTFAAAHNGYAVKVHPEAGAGRVKTTFKGTSGYYKVNVAYMEYAQLLDSSFRLYHNGKEIDFWYGKHDDGGRHVRQVSECMYVEKGDDFAIEGYSTGDGSLVDYLEFVAVDELICEKGVVIDEEYWQSTDGKVSSWDITGGEHYVKSLASAARYVQIKDQSANEKVVAKRPFVKVKGKNIILDLVMAATMSTGSGEITIGNGNTPAVVLTMDASGIKYVNKSGANATLVSSVPQWTGIRVVFDTEAKTYSLQTKSTRITGLPFSNDVSTLDNLAITMSGEATGTVELLNVSLTTGYLVYEDFKVFDGGYPRDWQRTTSGGASAVADAGGELADRSAWKLVDTSTSSSVSATKTFSLGTATKMTASFSMRTGDGLTAQIGSGLKVYTGSGNIYAGDGTLLWEGYSDAVWYKIRAEIDYAAKTADIYVNHVKKATVSITNTTVSNIKFSSPAVGTLTAYIDDVVIENTIYESPIPTPVPVDTGNYDIGMQACDLWRENYHFGWDSIRPYDNTRPIGGYYDEGSREQADLEIKWMVEHGITVYLPCWFRPTNPTKTPLTVGPKLDAFLSSPYISNMQFALTWENGSSQINSIDDVMTNILPYWIEHYFKNPQYYMVDGNRPLIAIWNSDRLRNNLSANGETTPQLFAQINAKLNEEGFGNAVFITNTQGSKTANEYIASEGYEYTYVYSYRDKSVEQQIDNQLAQTGYGKMDAIPVLSQGWGDEPWGRGTRKANMSLADWYGGLKYFKNTYMPARSSSSLASKFMMLDNWNEWGEGHALYPSNFAGFGYLDAVRTVFGNTSGTHTDYIPDRQNYLYVQ